MVVMTNTQPLALPPQHPLVSGKTANSSLVEAYQGKRSSHTPVWFMRQAGRSLPEYRELRLGTAMLDACLNPELSSEITLQPVRRHGVDAGIFFSDIVVPLKLAGVSVEIVPGRGPVFETPIRTAADVAALPRLDPAALAPVAEGVARTVTELGDTPLIGFAGAPFTLAAYMVEGGPSKDHMRARGLMHADPGTWQALMRWAAQVTGEFLRVQIEAGASAGQLFDSWAGSLSVADYVAHVAPASAAALDRARGAEYEVAGERRTVPLVHFGLVGPNLLPAMADVGVDALGVDYRTTLSEAAATVGAHVPLQGNLDPALLSAPWPVLSAAVTEVLTQAQVAPAHVFNLGHGVPPETDPAVLTRIVEFVHHQTVHYPSPA